MVDGDVSDAIASALRSWSRIKKPIRLLPKIAEGLQSRGFESEVLGELAARGTFRDVVLAVACLLGDDGARQELDLWVRKACRHAVSRLCLPQSAVPEIAQQLRTRLLVGGARTGPSLETFDGRGTLVAWLRVAASRQALMYRRAEAKHECEPHSTSSAVRERLDPELAMLEVDGAAAVKQAFQAAFDELGPHERMLLAYHYLDGLTYRRIAAIVGVDASTIARRLQKTRCRLLQTTRRMFASRFGDGDLEQVMRLVDSQLELSVSRLLRRDRATTRERSSGSPQDDAAPSS